MISNVAQHKSKNGVLAPYWDSALIEKTASGSVASFSDGSDGIPMVSVLASIEPKQSGTGDPSPDNVRPISGWDSVNVTRTGKNLYPVSIGADNFGKASGGNYTNNNGVLEVSQLSSNNSGVYSAFSNSSLRTMAANLSGSYIVSFDAKATVAGDCLIGYENVQTSTLSLTTSYVRYSLSCTFDATARSFIIYNRSGEARTVSIKDMQICLATATNPTAYEPYTAQTYPTTLPQTVYGGTLDLVSGVLTITHGLRRLDSLNITPNAITPNTFNLTGATDRYISTNDTTFLSNVYKAYTSTALGGSGIDSGMAFSNQVETIFVRDSRASTVDEIKALFTAENSVVCYRLATPQTIQLTPQEVDSLLADNVLFVDSGAVSVVYRADSTLAYNQLTNAIVSLGGNI